MERHEKKTVNVLVTFAGPLREPHRAGRSASEYLEVIRRTAPESWNILAPDDGGEDAILRLAAEADAIMGRDITGRMIESAPRLRIIQHGGSGVDSIDLDTATRRGVYVCNSKSNAVWVAEHAIALMLALTKDLVRRDADMRRGAWISSPSYHLKGKALGVVGLGAIGVEVAKRARPFEMRILATKRTPSLSMKERLGLEFLGTEADLGYVLGESDIVVLAVPKTASTIGLIGGEQIRKMKKGAFLINISRGSVVDEAALVEALKDGHLAGAGLDVFSEEPVDRSNPLLRLRNVILTPHVAGGPSDPSSEDWSSNVRFMVQNIARALAGEVPENVVNAISEPRLTAPPEKNEVDSSDRRRSRKALRP
jgi:D-3-phosphoglycerate dehydrogenase / 2-oxoglutarate reductase